MVASVPAGSAERKESASETGKSSARPTSMTTAWRGEKGPVLQGGSKYPHFCKENPEATTTQNGWVYVSRCDLWDGMGMGMRVSLF